MRSWLLLAVLLPLALHAETYYVRQRGSDAADGKTPNTAFATVLRGLQALQTGDGLVIGPGTYAANAFVADRGAVGHPLTITGNESGKLTGDPAGPVVITPQVVGQPAFTFYRCEGVQLSGLTFRGNGQGVCLEKCTVSWIHQCTFDGLSRGVAIDSCTQAMVNSCVVTRCTLGLFIKASQGATLQHNTITNATSAGIIVLSSSKGSIESSIFANNNTNFTVDDISAPSWSSDRNALTGITGPWGDVPPIANIYEWPAASGQDTHSVYVTPAFVNPKTLDFHIDPRVTWAGGLPGMSIGKDAGGFDRDGKQWRPRGGGIGVGAYDYPDPVVPAGWKVLKADVGLGEKRQSAGVFTETGTLVRTLLADATGVQTLYWDGRDDLGAPAPAGKYQVRAISHAVRLLDDGAIGDNGNPRGTYNCDAADRVVVLPDGGFIVAASYDEAGYAIRRYNATGQSIFASALAEKGFWGLGVYGNDVIGGLGNDDTARLVRIVLPGERGLMATGAESYPLLAKGEKGTPMGLAVKDGFAYVALAGLNEVRRIDLPTGEVTGKWPVPNVGDIALDAGGTLWVVSGTDVAAIADEGGLEKRFATGLAAVDFLAAGRFRLAAIDRKACKVALLDAAEGKVINTLGKDRTKQYFMPVTPDTFRDPRGAAFLPDGRLLLSEHSRVRMVDLEHPTSSVDLVSNFMESAVTHPTKPEYVYCGLGIYQVDEKTRAWSWVVETPTPPFVFTKENDPWAGKRIGSPGASLVIGGRPFIAYYQISTGQLLQLYDVSDPLHPRLALDYRNEDKVLGGWAYDTIAFGKGGDLYNGPGYTLQFRVIPCKGLDANNNPVYDFKNPVMIGMPKDPSPRELKHISALAADRVTGDIYYLATTALYNKMVPGWGADGTGVGRTSPQGTPLWYAKSSGGNYMSISTVNDGKQSWIFAAKSFGGQADLFDDDGLRVTTGNWSRLSGYSIGFVDLRFGIHAYRRADGGVGAYVEDDAIGRFARYRLDGAATYQKHRTAFAWEGNGAPAGPAPLPDKTGGDVLERGLVVKKVAPLVVDGDWSKWTAQGVTAQIVGLPCNVGFKRTMADGLMQSFREGTMIGALAHDGKNFYAYFLVADDTTRFDAPNAGIMWAYDTIELWAEEEQFGLGMLKDGAPALFKWRQHNAKGADWAANYALPKELVWAQKLTDLGAHPLGAQLAAITGTSFAGKVGYAVMARIPFDEVKLVGGIAGRKGGAIMPMTGAAGEAVRFAISLNNVSLRGRAQDYQIDWPSGKMFADPTRSYPFTLGE